MRGKRTRCVLVHLFGATYKRVTRLAGLAITIGNLADSDVGVDLGPGFYRFDLPQKDPADGPLHVEFVMTPSCRQLPIENWNKLEQTLFGKWGSVRDDADDAGLHGERRVLRCSIY